MESRLLHQFSATSLRAYHIAIMPYIWSVVIDISMLLPFYIHLQYSMIAHITLMVLVYATTFMTALQDLIKVGIFYQDKHFNHKLQGIIVMSLFAVQIMIGVVSRKAKQSSDNTKTVLALRKMHRVFGYSLIIMGKYTTIIILKPSHFAFWFVIIWSIFASAFFIYRLFRYPKAQKKIVSITNKQQNTLKQIYRIPEYFQSDKLYFILGNYLYQGKNIYKLHPGGRNILVSVRNRCVERYLFGIESLQNFISYNHSHSQVSLKLLDSPINRIMIKQPYTHFDQCLKRGHIEKFEIISARSRLHLIMVSLQSTETVYFKGYESQQQLGRYYSLSIGNMTRLFSVVSCLNYQNRIFLSKMFNCVSQNRQIIVHNRTKIIKNELVQQMLDYGAQRQSLIPLLIKLYPQGRFTSNIIKNRMKQDLYLSQAKGFGLQLSQEISGKIIMIGGGTGINPYLDLIDLLYKQLLIQIRPDLTNQIIFNNPILLKKPFSKKQFLFMIGINHIDDIPKLILKELQELKKANKAQVILKIKFKEDISEFFTDCSQSFENILTSMIAIQGKDIKRVYICGPQRLNKSISTCLNKEQFLRYIIL